MNRPTSSCQSLRSFPCDFRQHFHRHCYCSPCTLTFYIFHTHTHPPSYPCLDNLLTLQYFPLTLWVSTPHYVFSNATFSKEPLTKLSALLWIYIDSYLYYSSDISLCKLHSVTQQVFIELTFVFDIILVVQVSRLLWRSWWLLPRILFICT